MELHVLRQLSMESTCSHQLHAMLCVESVFLQVQVMNYDDVLLLVSKALSPLLFQPSDDTYTNILSTSRCRISGILVTENFVWAIYDLWALLFCDYTNIH